MQDGEDWYADASDATVRCLLFGRLYLFQGGCALVGSLPVRMRR